MSRTACNFSPSTKVFLQAWLTKESFAQEVLCFHKPQVSLNTRLFLGFALTGFFSLTEVLLFHKHTDSPIMGASDMSQVCTYVLSKTKVKTYSQMGHKNTLQIEGIL